MDLLVQVVDRPDLICILIVPVPIRVSALYALRSNPYSALAYGVPVRILAPAFSVRVPNCEIPLGILRILTLRMFRRPRLKTNVCMSSHGIGKEKRKRQREGERESAWVLEQ